MFKTLNKVLIKIGDVIDIFAIKYEIVCSRLTQISTNNYLKL